MYSTKQVSSSHLATDGDATFPAFAEAITFVGRPFPAGRGGAQAPQHLARL